VARALQAKRFISDAPKLADLLPETYRIGHESVGPATLKGGKNSLNLQHTKLQGRQHHKLPSSVQPLPASLHTRSCHSVLLLSVTGG
jgi:hypothetical protein